MTQSGSSRESTGKKYLGGKVDGRSLSMTCVLDIKERVKDDLGVLVLVTKVMEVLQKERNGLGTRGPCELCTG